MWITERKTRTDGDLELGTELVLEEDFPLKVSCRSSSRGRDSRRDFS